MFKLNFRKTMLCLVLMFSFALFVEKSEAGLFFNPWDRAESFVQKTLSRLGTVYGGPELKEAHWKLSEVFLRLQSPVGLQVPWLSSLLIVPEVEIVLEAPPTPKK